MKIWTLMLVVIDVNVVIAALLKDSLVRKIIVESGIVFAFPEPAAGKIRKYQDYIIGKSGISAEEFTGLFGRLFSFIHIIPAEALAPWWEQAKGIMGAIDPEDTAFIAAALYLGFVPVWTEDRHFRRQKAVPVLSTKDMAQHFLGR